MAWQTKVSYCKTTRYSSKKRWGIQKLVQYSTRPSKITGEMCVHLDWRACGLRQVEGIGIYYVKGIGIDCPVPLEALAAFDHWQFWSDHLRLEEVDYTMLGSRYLELTGQRNRYGVARVRNEWHCRKCNVFHGKRIGDAGRDGRSTSGTLRGKPSNNVRGQRGTDCLRRCAFRTGTARAGACVRRSTG